MKVGFFLILCFLQVGNSYPLIFQKFYHIQSTSIPFISYQAAWACWTLILVDPFQLGTCHNCVIPLLPCSCRGCCSCQEPRGEGMQLRRDLNFSKPAAGFSCHGEDSHGEHFSAQTRPLPADSCPDRFVPCSVVSFQPEIPHFPQKSLTFGWVAKPTCSTPGSIQPSPAVCSFPRQF